MKLKKPIVAPILFLLYAQLRNVQETLLHDYWNISLVETNYVWLPFKQDHISVKEAYEILVRDINESNMNALLPQGKNKMKEGKLIHHTHIFFCSPPPLMQKIPLPKLKPVSCWELAWQIELPSE